VLAVCVRRENPWRELKENGAQLARVCVVPMLNRLAATIRVMSMARAINGLTLHCVCTA
jgi:hypothetical protein